MAIALVSIGSNIDPEDNIPRALCLLRKHVRLLAVSTFYETEPLEGRDQPSFYNGAVRLDTDLGPGEFKYQLLRPIEEALGRQRCADRYAPRTIDLDIAVFGDAVIDEPGLVVPDPEIEVRPFLAVPLAELDDTIVLPNGKTITEVAGAMDTSGMRALDGFTDTLRAEIDNEH